MKTKIMEAKIAQKGPYAVELVAGKEYYWCACGKSQSQPFCNGMYHGTEFVPKVFKDEETKTAYLCGCKRSKNQPYCDGSHTGI